MILNAKIGWNESFENRIFGIVLVNKTVFQNG